MTTPSVRAVRPAAPLKDRRGTVAAREERAVERVLALMFLPLHKRNLGIAFGAAGAVSVGTVTLAGMLLGDEVRTALGLLGVVFRGYAVTWPGLLIGAAWSGAVGFVVGWFLAFCRNFVFACWLVLMRVRANNMQTHDFLDHI